MPKTTLAPTMGIRNAPISGPITPPILMCRLPSVFAEANSSLETISVTTEDEAGEPKAKPRLKRNALAKIAHGLRTWVSPRVIRQAAISACHKFTAQRIFFRSTMSARVPAGRVNTANGSAESVAIWEIRKAEFSVSPNTEKAAML